MKKLFFLFLLFCISVSAFSETNVKVNKEMYVKENLRLRAQETTSSSIINVMRTGSKVKIIKLGKEETIDNIKSNWVQIEVLNGQTREGETIDKGTKGWCFGGYLADYVGKYDYLDLTDREYKLQKIDFKSILDEAAWKKLAGYYFVGGPRKTISDPQEVDTPWGKDYAGFGLGCHLISYKDGIWTHGGDGEAAIFELVEISKDGNTFKMKNEYYSQTWKIDGEYLYIGSSSYYKITGPDCYKRFLKQFIQDYNESIKQYTNISSETKESIQKTSLEILKALSSGDIKTYAKCVKKNPNVKLTIGDYYENTNFSYNDLLEETEDVRKAFNFMKTDFSSHLGELDSIQPNINEFLRTTTDNMKKNYPEADILVEFIFNRYEEVSFFFKKENDSFILIGIIEYAVFRP